MGRTFQEDGIGAGRMGQRHHEHWADIGLMVVMGVMEMPVRNVLFHGRGLRNFYFRGEGHVIKKSCTGVVQMGLKIKKRFSAFALTPCY
jgi:hypothetical protein